MTPLLYASYISAIVLIVAVPAACAVWLRRSYPPATSWRYLAYGCLVFLAVQAVVRLPLLKALQVGAASLSWPVVPPLVVLAASAGVFEEIGRYAGYRFLFRKHWNWRAGVMYGLGHGGFESLVVAGQMAVTVYLFAAYSSLDISVVQFSSAQLAEIARAREWWLPLAGAFERLAMLPIHVALSVMVLQVFTRGRRWWLGAAIGSHLLVNLSVALTIRCAGFLVGELLAAAFAGAALLVIARLREEERRPGARHEPPPSESIR